MFSCIIKGLPARDATYQLEELFRAIQKGDVEEALSLIPLVDVNYKDTQELTPLHYAAIGNLHTVVAALVSRGANVNAKSKDGSTPLVCAVASATIARCSPKALNPDATTEPPMWDYLLQLGADINASDADGRSLVSIAISNGNYKVAAGLIDKGANLLAADHFGITPLHIAAQQGSNSMITTLVSKGADVNAKSKKGITPLTMIPSTDRDIVELLIELGADINSIGKRGRTPLMAAVTRIECSTDSVQWLLANGAGINLLDAEGLAHQLYHSNISLRKFHQHFCKAINYLLDCGADVVELFHMVAKWGGKEGLDVMVPNMAAFEVDLRDEDGNTPLINALYHENRDTATWLMEHKADPNIANKTGRIASKMSKKGQKETFYIALSQSKRLFGEI